MQKKKKKILKIDQNIKLKTKKHMSSMFNQI